MQIHPLSHNTHVHYLQKGADINWHQLAQKAPIGTDTTFPCPAWCSYAIIYCMLAIASTNSISYIQVLGKHPRGKRSTTATWVTAILAENRQLSQCAAGRAPADIPGTRLDLPLLKLRVEEGLTKCA